MAHDPKKREGRRPSRLAPTPLPLTFGVLLLAAAAAGADLSGEWEGSFTGSVHSLDRPPLQESVSAESAITIQQVDDLLVIDVGAIGDALPATAWKARFGPGGFAAVHTSAGEERILYGRLLEDRLEGKVVRASSGGSGPAGWVELTFVAHRSGTASVTPEPRNLRRRIVPRLPQDAIPRRPGLPPTSPPLAGPDEASFEIDLIDATAPATPTDRQQVRFALRAEPPPGVEIDRVELLVNGRRLHTTAGAVVDFAAGPFPVGSLSYSLVAYSKSGARAASESRSLTVRAAGSGEISGTVSGRKDLVRRIELVDADETTVQTAELNSAGRYRFGDLPEGVYWVVVDDGKSEARIRVTRGSRQVRCDGSSSYRVDFRVE